MTVREVRKTYKYRLYPNRNQAEALEGQLEEARRLYNAALRERRDAWRMIRRSLNYYDQANQLKAIRAAGDLGLANYSACQDVLRRVDKAFKTFFRRVKAGQKPGYPRFKGPNRFDSYTFPTYGNGCKLWDDGRLSVQGVGAVKVKLHRPVQGDIKTVTLKRECGRWYAAFSCVVETSPLPSSEESIGIDVGLESFVTTSEGQVIRNPRYLREAEETLIRAQQRLSRRRKGSKRRKRAVNLVAKHYQEVKNRRRDFHHQVARRLVNEYDFIAAENLCITNMVQDSPLAKNILDAGWGQFISILSAKAAEAGREMVLVNPSGTSQECSGCGAHVAKFLAERAHVCPYCNLSLHRDLNASRNILRLGLSLRANAREAVCSS